MMRSESTNALGHPRETKLTLGAVACRISGLLNERAELVLIAQKYKAEEAYALMGSRAMREKKKIGEEADSILTSSEPLK